MPNASANLHNLNEGRIQALQALQHVSGRLSEILGDTVTDDPGDGIRRDEGGELRNEDGLPIVDITEPVDDLDTLDTPSLSAASEEDGVIEEDNYPEPTSKLSSEALAISRKHRDKILELLEEEEEREERRTRREHQNQLQQKREAAKIEMQKRMMSQGAELDKRRRAKELEKKMAKALISGLASPEPAVSSAPVPDSRAKIKKTVAFADHPSPSPQRPVEQHGSIDWGDVVPGRLLATQITSARTQPMKKEVIERTSTISPKGTTPIAPTPEPLVPAESVGDSDDESGSEDDTSDSTIAPDSEDGDIVLSAQRHRELALEYHRRRNALSSNAGASDPADTRFFRDCRTQAADWDKEEVPLDATLTHPRPKPAISKFKASVLNRTDGSSVTPVPHSDGSPLSDPSSPATFGTLALPPGALAGSIKMGKIVDGRLVAGHDDGEVVDQEDQEEEKIRELLLKSVKEYSGIAAQVMGPAVAGSYWAEADDPAPSSSAALPTVKPKVKASRFKVNRAHCRAPSGEGPQVSSDPSASAPDSRYQRALATRAIHPRSSTPVSGAGRSSPKLASIDQRHTSVEATTSSSNVPTGALGSLSLDPLGNPLLGTVGDIPMDQPSYLSSRSVAEPPTSAFTVIDSPSFTFPSSNIIESPSFRRTVKASHPPHTVPASPPTVIHTPSPRSAEREVSVMTSDVKERSSDHNTPADSGPIAKPRRVSRFKAERSAD